MRPKGPVRAGGWRKVKPVAWREGEPRAVEVVPKK
jgi:hypothetical protein